MFPVGLLLTLSLAFGVLAQSCDVGAFTIDDVTDTVTVVNASESQGALVVLSTNLVKVDTYVRAATSQTFNLLAATTYTLAVWGPRDPSAATYKQSLVDLRSELMELSINPGDTSATPESALGQLVLVQLALEQLNGSKSVQTCTGSIKSGVENHATVTWTQPTFSGFWVLDCG